MTTYETLNTLKSEIETGTKELFYWDVTLTNPKWKKDEYHGLDPAIEQFLEASKQHEDYKNDTDYKSDLPSLHKKASILTEKDIRLFNSGKYNVRLNLEGKNISEGLELNIKDGSVEFNPNTSLIDSEDENVIYKALSKIGINVD